MIDADIDLQKETIHFLRTHKWTGRYSNVSFIPHKTNEVYTANHKVAMYKRQNEWASELKRIIINVNNATDLHFVEGSPISFQNWLCITPLYGKRVIMGVEVAPKNIVRVLFHQNSRYDVEHILQNLYSLTLDTFGKQIADIMLDEKELKKIQTNHKDEISHSQSLLQLSANPQGGSDPSQFKNATNRKTTFHYGTYLDVTKGENTQASEITTDQDNTVNELRNAVKDLQSKQESLENKLSTTIDNAVDKKIIPLKQEITIMRTTNDSKIGEVLTQIGNLQSNQAVTIANAVTNAMAAFYNQTPSGRAELPPGVPK